MFSSLIYFIQIMVSPFLSSQQPQVLCLISTSHLFLLKTESPPRGSSQNDMSRYNKIIHMPYIKPVGGNPVGGKGSQMQVKESETALIPTVRGTTKTPS